MLPFVYMCLKCEFIDDSTQLYLNYPSDVDMCLETFLHINVE